jgi:hypothetical protein
MSSKSGKKKRKPIISPEQLEKARERKQRYKQKQRTRKILDEMGLTGRQSKFMEAWCKGVSLTRAAIEAGYSNKNPSQSGYQIVKRLQKKSPEVVAKLGISLEGLIEKHLKPKLDAKDVILAQHEGEFTDIAFVDNHMVQLAAFDRFVALMGAMPTKDEQLQQQQGVKTVVIDIPAPDFSMVNQAPRSRPRIEDDKTSGNGHKPPEDFDPRPKD